MGFFESEGILSQSFSHFTGGEQRQITARKQLFGVECFDLLAATSQTSRMKIFMHQVDPSGAEAYMLCEQDIVALEAKKSAKLDKLADLIVDGNTRGGDTGEWLVNQIETQVSDMDKQIRTRKEQFGIDFFDAIPTSDGAITTRMKVNKAKGRALQECIEKAKHDVWLIENRQQLEAEGRLAEC